MDRLHFFWTARQCWWLHSAVASAYFCFRSLFPDETLLSTLLLSASFQMDQTSDGVESGDSSSHWIPLSSGLVCPSKSGKCNSSLILGIVWFLPFVSFFSPLDWSGLRSGSLPSFHLHSILKEKRCFLRSLIHSQVRRIVQTYQHTHQLSWRPVLPSLTPPSLSLHSGCGSSLFLLASPAHSPNYQFFLLALLPD